MYGQSNSTCSCEGLIDTEYKGLINIYDRPNGSIKAKLKHNFVNEDYLIFTIEKTFPNYFKVTIAYSISGKAISGWVKKEKHLGTYPRAYSETVQLYSKPNERSKVAGIIQPENAELAQILNCTNDWTYVRLKVKTSLKEGWLKRSDQCPNPYTTCN